MYGKVDYRGSPKFLARVRAGVMSPPRQLQVPVHCNRDCSAKSKVVLFLIER